MGPFALIALLLFPIIIATILIWALFFLLRHFGIAKGKIIGRIVIGLPLLLTVLVVGGVLSSYLTPNLLPPKAVYQQVFGVPASAKVNIIKSKARGGTDFGEAYLLFETEQPYELSEITKAMDNQGNIRIKIPDDRPDWWVPGKCADKDVFSQSSVRGWDQIFLMHCRADKRYYVYAVWID